MEFGYKISKTTKQVSLGEDISKLVSNEDGEQLEFAVLKMLVSDMAIDLNVLGVFVEDIIMSNVNSTTIVIRKRSGSRLWSIYVNQEPMKPNKLASGVCKGTILSLSTRTRNHMLLLTLPRDKRSTQQETETCDRASISRITYPIRI